MKNQRKKSNELFNDGIEMIRTYKTRRAAIVAAAQFKRHKKHNVIGDIFRATVCDKRRKDYGKSVFAIHVINK